MEMNTLDELERLLKAGTPGPWKIERGKRCIQGPDTFEGEPLVLASMMGGRQWSASPYSQYCVPGMKDGDANAALIVAAINALPGLIESARRVEELEVALKPFAVFSECFTDVSHDDAVGARFSTTTISVGAFRHARAALKGT
jgi:hypothetical protein